MQRRKFLRTTSRAGLGLGLLGLTACQSGNNPAATTEAPPAVATPAELWFDISLAQWSLNKALFGGEMDNLDFARRAKEDFGISGIEYVNQFFKDKATDAAYLAQMNQRAADHGVKQLLIMIDGEGDLGSTDTALRTQAVNNHHKWVAAAATLGCHSIRVNAAGQGTREEVGAAATEGLRSLAEYAKKSDINVIVENHGGYSSDGSWLAKVIENTEMENCGTLPDFGNFCIERNDPQNYEKGCKTEYDRYRGVRELMPYAFAVSAKTHDFGTDGMETNTDYVRMLQLVKDVGYKGWIGIEYEGSGIGADEGIRATKALLERAGRMVS